MIRVENLVKNYNDVKAVRSISFEVHDGEILGFLGANGAGKSTTLKILSGYLSQTSGDVYINDLNIREDSLEVRNQIGYLPELNPLYPDMRVYDLLEFVAKIRDIKGKAFKQALARVIEQCGLSGIVHKRIGECSKGYKQRTGLAMAMIHDPKILFLDEPVSGLDPNQIVEIRELIKNLGQEKIVMMSSHILQEIQATVNRMIIIHNGEIVANGTNEELMSNFKGRTQLTMEVKNAKEKNLNALNEKVDGITILKIEKNSSGHHISLEYEQSIDPREDLFKYALKSKWTIIEMSPHKANLEDIFRTLTIKGGADA